MFLFAENITNYITDEDLLIFNDTKVDPVLLFTKDEKNNSREILLVREIDQRTWTVLTKNPKNTRISFCNGTKGYLRKINGEWRIVFDCESSEVIQECGKMSSNSFVFCSDFCQNRYKFFADFAVTGFIDRF